jgi:biopolymer transport protein ExbB
MYWLIDSFEAIRDFMNLGGVVLKSIAVVIFLMWVLIVERILFFRSSMKQMSKEIHDNWEMRQERRSWHAHQIRELLISQFSGPPTRASVLFRPLSRCVRCSDFSGPLPA